MPKKSKNTETEQFNFAAQLQTLNALVEKMEGHELPLEEALLCFERGVALVRECQQKLKAAERKVQKLSKQYEKEINEEDFDNEDDQD